MSKQIKTSEDLQNDTVGFIYGVFKLIKYAIIFAVICVAWFFYTITTVSQ